MSSNETSAAPPLGELIEAGGRRLALRRAGQGGPAVVFLPGAGMIGLDFLNVADALAPFATTVIYDRGGTGWSDDAPLPRSAADAAGELRALLHAASIAPPYVLVGHSLGGAYARRYAQLFPGEVAGLVFLDPAHEGYAHGPRQGWLAQLRMTLKLAGALIDAKGFYRPKFERTYAAWPQGLRQTLVDYHVRAWSRTLAETKNLNSEVLGEIAGGGPLPPAPMIVLTAAGFDPFMTPFMDAGYLAQVNAAKQVMHDEFAAEAGGENRLVDAGHSTLHTEQPGAVMAAVRDVLARAGQRGGIAAAA